MSLNSSVAVDESHRETSLQKRTNRAICYKSFGVTIKHSKFKGSVLILFPIC